MPQEDESQQEKRRLQREADRMKPQKKVSVVSYLAILFGIAFLLLLLTYFMQQRSNEAAILGLKENMKSFQSVENLLEVNKRLETEKQDLEDRADKLDDAVKALEKQKSQLGAQAEESTKAIQAMDWLWRIQRTYSKGQKAEAKKLITQFEATKLPLSLPQYSTFPDGPTPADQYDAILAALGIKKAEP